ncbi:TrlF family AAA-like ATPase [Mesorhizobium sp. M1169]|uniref:TrlF family AAA-like ATPase n=1 Tax=Mesorhizobium sp. M1169 TaxID=2957066 RepID=UPI003338295D
MSVSSTPRAAKREAHRGSQWLKWDLHLHAPGTKLSCGYGKPEDATWKRFVAILEQSEVKAFGITDYFSFDGYLNTVKWYRQSYPDSTKLVIPNLELRLTETVSIDGKNVNAHVLVDPAVATAEALSKFLNDLETHISVGGRRLRCSELTSANYAAATVSIHDVKDSLKGCFAPEQYIIVTAAGNDGLRGTAKNSQRSKSISDELDRISSAFFGKSNSTAFFLSDSRYEDGSKSEPKPLYDASDAHSFEDLGRLTGDEPSYQSTWIKANLTFRGLRQTIFEPEHRVFVGDRPTVLVRLEREATQFIDRLEINALATYADHNGTWFRNVEIPFNPELTAIIGNKGSGKSAVADIVALLGNTRQAKYFSFLTDSQTNKKFKRPGFAENFSGRLVWKSGSVVERTLSDDVDELEPEAVKYLPQNYFESLTNEIEVQALRREIEDVVFSHVDISDKMDAKSFRDLEERKTLNSRQEASQIKTKLRELNIRILELEDQSEPAFKTKLQAELGVLQKQVFALEASKPPEEAAPAAQSAEQEAATEEIASQTRLLDDLSAREKSAVTRLGWHKTTLQEASEFKDAVNALKNRVQGDKEAFKTKYSALGLDVDQVIRITVNLEEVTKKIEDANEEIAQIERESAIVFDSKADLSKVASAPELRAAQKYIADRIAETRAALSAPQQRYQRYVQAVREISEQISDIVGQKASPKLGTIAELEARIARIDNDLPGELSKAFEDRKALCLTLFESKHKIRTFYEGLKTKVESRLTAVSTGDFKVSIDASFVPSPKFGDEFFNHLNQNVSGPFRGVAEGARALQQKLSIVDWNSFESIFAFVHDVVGSMKSGGIRRQTKDVKKFYDFLYSLGYFEPRYELRLGGKDLNQLSPGEKGLLLLVFYLHLDTDSSPLIIDQPEDNLDNDSIFAVLARCIRDAKKTRQVILVTHNPNLAIGADAEQIVYVRLDKVNGYRFSYDCGAIENPNTNGHIVRVLEGSRPAFVQRRLKYQIT